MLEELLKHDKLGNREELLFFLFDGLSAGYYHSLPNVRKYCISNVFSISRCFKGLIELFQFMSFIEITENSIFLNKKHFNQITFDKKTYLDQFHFYDNLIHALKNAKILHELFNENNLKFNPILSQYYVLDNKFPYKYFSLRNMLFSTGFFQRNENLPNHLIIRNEFTDHFRKCVINDLTPKNNFVNKISLDQLKKGLQAKADTGKLAELFVFEYECRRLNGHPNIGKVGIISDEYVNAGYDIETFEGIDSIILDRFVEVKSYQGEISFFWSRNEIAKAKELRNKYFLYLVDRSRIEEKDYTPQKFQDPYKKIFESNLWKKETENWDITFIE